MSTSLSLLFIPYVKGRTEFRWLPLVRGSTPKGGRGSWVPKSSNECETFGDKERQPASRVIVETIRVEGLGSTRGSKIETFY